MTDPGVEGRRYPWDLPGYRAAMDAAQATATDRYGSQWEADVVELAVDAALPIIVEALAQQVMEDGFQHPYYFQDYQRYHIRDWLRSKLTERVYREKGVEW